MQNEKLSANAIKERFAKKTPVSVVEEKKPVEKKKAAEETQREEMYREEGKRRAKERKTEVAAEQSAKTTAFQTTLNTTLDAALRFNAKRTSLKMLKYNLTMHDIFMLGLEQLENKSGAELESYVEERKQEKGKK